ncbi:hypothetical protein [Ornithinimicrobium kibberense]|uniref:hypothetical protein n=1 Tax=Ornithinimicrobium kibberense TaxID=282060 RepID=UPI003607A0F3
MVLQLGVEDHDRGPVDGVQGVEHRAGFVHDLVHPDPAGGGRSHHEQGDQQQGRPRTPADAGVRDPVRLLPGIAVVVALAHGALLVTGPPSCGPPRTTPGASRSAPPP